MDESGERKPGPAENGGGDERIQRLVERFLARHGIEEAEQPGCVERYLEEEVPPELRAEVGREIEGLLSLERMLLGEIRGERTPPPASDLRGRRFGDFELLREIGRGGMGVVYLARQTSLDRIVALKVLSGHLALSERALERFRREPKAVGRLQHPGIVQVLAVGEHEGSHWFAMEYVEGESLDERLKRMRAAEAEKRRAGKRSGETTAAALQRRGWIAEAVGLCAEVADALDHAHHQGLIHRDVKPHNVLIDRQGHARLVDFGLAKGEGSHSLSRTGDLAGTPHYMSPEQALAKRIRVDHRTDIYSLGVILYELLTLRRPFEGDTMEQVLFAISFKNPTPVRKLNPRVPRDLETICMTAMEKSPEHRYGTAAEFAADLRRFLAHESIVARPPSPLRRVSRVLVQRRREVAVFACTFALAGAAFGVREHVLHARERGAALRSVLEAVPADLARAPAEALRDLLVAARRTAERFPDLEVTEAEELGRLVEAIEAEGRRRLALGLEERRRGMAPGATGQEEEGGRRVQSDTEFFLGQRHIQEASFLVPVDAELLDARSGWPTVTLVADRALDGSRVYLREVDPIGGRVGEPVEIGHLPLSRAPVPPGLVRIVVETPGVGHAEITRYLSDRGRDHRLRVWVRPDAEVLAGMRAVPAGPYVLGVANPTDPRRVGEPVELAAYHIDEHEVTIGEYLAFLEDTGLDPSELLLWDLDRLPANHELPIAGVNALGAALYAEWAGKRLPTTWEWERAARGEDGRRLPWGDDGGAPEELANLGRPGEGAFEFTEDLSGFLADYAQSVVPVRDAPEGSRSPYGLLHVLGNVAEWTETPAAETLDGRPLLSPHYREVRGGYWGSMRDIDSTREIGLTITWTTPAARFNHQTGLRCAKSDDP